MARICFGFTRKGQGDADAALEDLIGTATCTARVAGFLGIEAAPNANPTGVTRTRAAHTKNVLKNGTYTDITVPAGDVSYTPDTSPRGGYTAILKTGLRSPKGNYRTVSMTFSSGMTVGQIGEALAETLPETTINRTGAISATQVAAEYTIQGGRTYPIPTKVAAEASTSVNAPDTAEATTAALTAADKKVKPATTTP